jgi:hypothetical protein
MFMTRPAAVSSCALGANDPFYVEDPWKNPLCFVEEGTVYAG